MPEPFRSQAEMNTDWCFIFDNLTEAQTRALAADIAPLLGAGDLIALEGDLGLGKSTFARALLRARAQDPRLEVPSPTFTLVQSYDMAAASSPLVMHHFDLYRISDFEELYEIGFEESWQTGCALVEWPDRAEDLLPRETLWLHFNPAKNGDARCLSFSGRGSWGARLQDLCVKRAFLMQCDWGDALRTPIKGDLSPRSYDRIVRPPDADYGLPLPAHERPERAILMNMPECAAGPVLADGRLYDIVAHRVTKLAPMLSIRDGLQTMGLRVPDHYGSDTEQGMMLWEDFGAKTLATGPQSPIPERYLATVAALAHLHSQPLPTQFKGSGGAHQLSHYDLPAFKVELEVFLDHYWPHIHKMPCPSAKREEFAALWHPELEKLVKSEQELVLRDVQDPNCFWLNRSDGATEVGFIDFQDCLIGPAAYDLAALAMDARVSIDEALERDLLMHYRDLRGFDDSQAVAFEEAYNLCAAQRISKNLGAFARAAHQAGRVEYLAHIPRSLNYLSRTMAHPALAALKSWYDAEGLLEARVCRPDRP